MVIFLVSPVWAASKWCLAEFLLAKSLNERIFALIVEPTPFEVLPVELTAEWQVVDLTAGSRDYATTVALPPGDKTAKVAFASDGLNRLRIGPEGKLASTPVISTGRPLTIPTVRLTGGLGRSKQTTPESSSAAMRR